MVMCLVYCWAMIARSVAVVACMSECDMCWICTSPVIILPTIGSFPGIWGFTDQMTIGKACSFITVWVQLNWGLNVESHGYPRTMSSFPTLVMRNHISLHMFFISTFRSI